MPLDKRTVHKKVFDHSCYVTPLAFLGFSKEIFRYTRKYWGLSEESAKAFFCVCLLIECSPKGYTNEQYVFRSYRMLNQVGSRQLAGYHALYRLGILNRVQKSKLGMSIVVTDKGKLIMNDVIASLLRCTLKKCQNTLLLNEVGVAIDAKDLDLGY